MSLLSSIQAFRNPAPDLTRSIEQELAKTRLSDAASSSQSTTAPGALPSFGQMLGDLVEGVDASQKASQEAVRQVMAGESDNLHQTMIAMQEAGVAFNLMLEVRNKLVEGYQELMRLRV